MNEKQIREQFESDMQEFAKRYSLDRVKTESLNFVRDYRRDADGVFRLVSEKAVIRALGKTSKVTIGEGGEYPDYESAKIGVRKKWSAYFKKQREKRSEAAKRGEQRRQKRYRDKRKAGTTAIKRNQ